MDHMVGGAMKYFKQITLLSLVLIVFGLALAGPAFAEPKLMIEKSVISLSEPIDEGEKITGEFIIENQGDTDLEIKKVVPG
jgi:hypothetical protein